MAFVKVTCTGCGRDMQLTVERAARRPKCMYCGKDLNVAAEHAERVDDAATRLPTAATTARKGKVPVECPICLRRNLYDAARVGEHAACTYCACPFAVVDAGASALPGPAGAKWNVGGPRDVAADERALRDATGLDRTAAMDSRSGTRDVLIRAALAALVERVIRGHCTIEELQRATARVWAATRARPPSGGEWLCPLEPEAAADLVLRVIAPGMEGTSTDREIDGVVVRLLTESHWETTTSATVDMRGAVVGGLIGAALGLGTSTRSHGRIQQIEIKHYLRIAFHRQPEGSRTQYASQYATGEIEPLTAKQGELAQRVGTELARDALPFMALKAIFGEWFGATQRLGLAPQALSAALERIGGEVATAAPRIVPALVRSP